MRPEYRGDNWLANSATSRPSTASRSTIGP
jgi:hypothetical protein